MLASFGNLFGLDGLIILAIGLLIFGRRLPEVAQNLWHTFDPRADPAPLAWLCIVLMLILVVAKLSVSSGILH